MKGELDDKDNYISNLRKELTASQAKVVELSDRVEDLNQNVEALTGNIDSLNAQSEEQQTTIRLQDAALNSVYYYVATMEVLKDKGLVTKNGVFSKESVSSTLDKGIMHTADRRELSILPLNTKKAIILTNHPESSYQITIVLIWFFNTPLIFIFYNLLFSLKNTLYFINKFHVLDFYFRCFLFCESNFLLFFALLSFVFDFVSLKVY